MAGVGTEKVFENDKVIVWNFVLAPGEETPVHTHEHSYMWYAIDGAPLQVFDEHGERILARWRFPPERSTRSSSTTASWRSCPSTARECESRRRTRRAT